MSHNPNNKDCPVCKPTSDGAHIGEIEKQFRIAHGFVCNCPAASEATHEESLWVEVEQIRARHETDMHYGNQLNSHQRGPLSADDAKLKLADRLIDKLWEKVLIYSKANGQEYIGGTPVQFLSKMIEGYKALGVSE